MEFSRIIKPAVLSVSAMFLSSAAVLAQAAPAAAPVAAKPSVYSNPIFYTLALVAMLLLIFIVQLAGVLSAVAKNYSKGDKSIWDKMRNLAVLVGILLFASSDATAQMAASAPAANESNVVLDFLHDGFGYNAVNALAAIILFELFVVFYLVRMIKLFTTKEKELAPLTEKQIKTSVFWDRFNASVSVEAEAAVLTDHDYDGIRELDNSLPPWWKYGFYFTILWAVVYLVYFHISSGPSSLEEYNAQIEEGTRQAEEFRAKSKNLVDETNVVMLADASDISAGQSIFAQYCAVCHNADGGGLVGPNLTDTYWIHGGDIKDIFKTIKLGVQGKGMKSWQQELSPVMMAQVSSFIKTLQGTKPATPKAPEGQEWIDTAPSATTAADSTAMKLPADTTAVK